MAKPKVLDLTHGDYVIRDDSSPQIHEEPFREGVGRDLEESIEVPTVFRKALHGPFKGIDLTGEMTPAKLVQGLTSMIPLNQYDLPMYIYRIDLLDAQRIITVLTDYTAGLNRSEEMQEITAMLDASAVILNYDQGFPVLPNGKVFWEEMDYESTEAHRMFLTFLELDGIRKLTQLDGFPQALVQEYFHTHFWNYRAQAFDLYRVANTQRTRLNRMLSTEDKHFRIAEKMTTKLEKYFEDLKLDGEDSEITPDKAVAMLEKLVGISRISVGLPRNGEARENNGARQLVSPQQMIGLANNSGGRETSAVDDDFDDILGDPESIALAQELILKRQSRGNMD